MILVLICLLLNTHLHILRERKKTIKLLKEFLGCNLCITLGHTYVAMSEHLAHRFYWNSLLKRDKCGKDVSCRMRGKGKGYTLSKAQCFKIRLIGGILYLCGSSLSLSSPRYFSIILIASGNNLIRQSTPVFCLLNFIQRLPSSSRTRCVLLNPIKSQ